MRLEAEGTRAVPLLTPVVGAFEPDSDIPVAAEGAPVPLILLLLAVVLFIFTELLTPRVCVNQYSLFLSSSLLSYNFKLSLRY